jgi:type I restriction enzyme S subunit
MNQVNSFLVGSNYPAINSKDVRHLFIPLPPLPEQRQIAAILSTVDEKIAAIDQQLAEMEQLKKGLMRRLLTKGMGHSEFKETKIGKIPIDWEVVKLGYKCDVRDGTHDSPKYVFEGIPFITSKNLSANGLDLVNVNYISKKDHEHFSKRSQVERGDIIFGMIGTVGNPVIVNTNIEFSIKNVALVKFKENNTFNNMFVLIILDSEIVKNQFRKISNGGVQSFVSLGAIRNLYFPLPSLYEQKKIAGILSTADEKLDVLREKKGGYQILKKGLMQKLLTGDIRVKAKGE